MELDLSDHKPVNAIFDVQVKHQIESKKNQVLREIMMQLDKWENENMPKVRLLQSNDQSETLEATSSGVFTFHHLRYGLEQQRKLVIENTGVVVAQFRFIPKLEDVSICKPWLRVYPTHGMIPPKSREVIMICARIGADTAHSLSSGEESLDDTMILRVENGRDYFLVVTGHYDTSCFGSSLEQLVDCVDPVRLAKRPIASSSAAPFFVDHGEVNGSQITSTAGSQSTQLVGEQKEAGGNAQHIPKELWRMVNDIYQHFMNEKNLFVEAGNKQEIVILREALDTGHAFPQHSAYSMAELLLSWLQSLRESVVPDDTLTTALTNGHGNVAQTCRLLLDSLSVEHYNVLIYLIAFLKEILKHASGNKLTAEKLSFVFARCLVSQYRPLQRTSSSVTVTGGADVGSVNLTPPSSIGSTSSSVSTAPSSGGPEVFGLLPEEQLRHHAREAEVAQAKAAHRADRMEKMLLFWLTTNAT
ncbi:hypothetical protein PINS_up004540 [Pythium insidiosum]|nr:hypothetical protein PINS_up004540 [Pythium insidiosum]